MSTLAQALEVRVPLQPKQVELLDLVENSAASWIGYGGSRGGAKSHGARAVMLIRRLQHAGTRGLIFRRTFNDLWENHIQPMFRDWPFMRAWYHTQHHEITLPNSSVIKFDYAEHKGDINKFQGKEYMDICVDEATHLTEDELVFLRTSNRRGSDAQGCKMILTCNPGNVGHAFIKRTFIKHEYHDKEQPEDYAFLQARAWDNVQWALTALAQDGLSESDYYSWNDEQRFNYFLERTQYGRNLDALPAAMRIGHLLGDWDQFAGQFFDIFDQARHVKHQNIEPWYPRWISIDWGFAHDAAVYWHTTLSDGRHHTYRGLVQNNLTPAMLVAEIAARSQNEKIQQIFVSHDARNRRDSPETILLQINTACNTHGLPQPAIADTERHGGWMLMYQLLQSDYWSIDPSCTKLIEGMAAAIHDPDDLEDILKVDGDDSIDSVRYGLKSRLSPGKVPLDVRIAQRVAKAEEDKPLDMTQKMMLLARVTAEEKKATHTSIPLRRHWMQKRWQRN